MFKVTNADLMFNWFKVLYGTPEARALEMVCLHISTKAIHGSRANVATQPTNPIQLINERFNLTMKVHSLITTKLSMKPALLRAYQYKRTLYR